MPEFRQDIAMEISEQSEQAVEDLVRAAVLTEVALDGIIDAGQEAVVRQMLDVLRELGWAPGL